MQKMFKGDYLCPYTGNVIDSVPCRNCGYFFKPGTYTFIWCSHELPPKEEVKRKPGRPKKQKGDYPTPGSKGITPGTDKKKKRNKKKAK